MKTRESGMPAETQWERFFDPETILDRLQLHSLAGDIVEFGCGYGTFTIPAARRCSGSIFALDIDPTMIARTAVKAIAAQLPNIKPLQRDFVNDGTGLAPASVAYAMLFNILHAVESPAMLAEAWRVLKPGGLVGIMHWNCDPTTPRGPSMAIRPRPADCLRLALAAGLETVVPEIDLPPYHYGLVLKKPSTTAM